jgi:hypothetical protein
MPCDLHTLVLIENTPVRLDSNTFKASIIKSHKILEILQHQPHLAALLAFFILALPVGILPHYFGSLAYNTGVYIRALTSFYRRTGERKYLTSAL